MKPCMKEIVDMKNIVNQPRRNAMKKETMPKKKEKKEHEKKEKKSEKKGKK